MKKDFLPESQPNSDPMSIDTTLSHTCTKRNVVRCFDIEFSKPDRYGEVHSRIETFMDSINGVMYIDLKINKGETIRFHFKHNDAGTMAYASMKGEYAINGQLTNISMNWASPKETDLYKIIYAIGTVDNGQANLHLWMTAKKQRTTQGLAAGREFEKLKMNKI